MGGFDETTLRSVAHDFRPMLERLGNLLNIP